MRKNTQSILITNVEDEWEATFKSHVSNKTNEFFHNILDMKDTMHTDQIGLFSCKLLRENNCVFFCLFM